MAYNFDEAIERAGTGSVKWDSREAVFGRADVLPMWVADLDFRVPQEVTDAIAERARHGIFGYNRTPEEYCQAGIDWVGRRFGWTIEREWMADSQSVMVSLANVLRRLTRPGAKVIIQPPVYDNFRSKIEACGRVVLENPLKFEDGRYEIDFDDLERKAAEPDAECLVLCSPHNPVGRVWTREELRRLGDICLRHRVLVVSDEIHWDFVFSGHRHLPFASLSEEFAQGSITLFSTGKSFNFASLGVSWAVIPNPELREKFDRGMKEDFFLFQLSPLNVAAVTAAYRHGERWMNEAVAYIEGNFRYMEKQLRERLPEIALTPAEGTYLAWLDFRRLGLEPEELSRWLVDELKLGVLEGSRYGTGGAGFVRINLGCPRRYVEECLERLAAGVQALRAKAGI